jgi:hypothetical protein
MRPHLCQYLLAFLIIGCAHVTITQDTPEDLDGFLRLPWGLAPDIVKDQMLSWPNVTIDRTLSDNSRGVLVFHNVTFLDIPVDRCTMIFFELDGLSDVQLRFLRPDTSTSNLFDSLRTSMQKVYGPGVSRNHRIEWGIRRLRGHYMREGQVVLALEPNGSLLLHAHGDYDEIRHR